MTNPRRYWLTTCIIGALLLCVRPAAAADQDDPRYSMWSEFPVGSSATMSGSFTYQGKKMDMTSTVTLKAIDKDKQLATIGTGGTVTAGGQKTLLPPTTATLRAKSNRSVVTETGEKDVDAAGQTFKCKVYEVQNLDKAGKPDGKKLTIYLSDKVPGGVVKSEGDIGNGATESMTLKSFHVQTAEDDKPVDNPEDPRVAAWAGHNLGSAVHLTGSMLSGPSKGKVDMTFTLKKVSADKKSVVIEATGTVSFGDRQTKLPTNIVEYPEKHDKIAVTSGDAEDVDANGKTYTCNVYKITSTDKEGVETKDVYYVSKNVPGYVKVESSTPQFKIKLLVESLDEK